MTKKDAKPRPREFATDEKEAAHRLTIEKEADGFRVSVRSGNEEPDGVLVEPSDPATTELAHVRRMVDADGDDRVVIAPKGRGVFEVFAISEKEASAPVVVEFSASKSAGAAEQIGRLYRVLGGDDPAEDDVGGSDEAAIDADDGDRALVFSPGARTELPHGLARNIYPSDLLAALREIEAEIDRRPGDPGRAVHLSERVRCVLAEAGRQGGRER